MLLQPLIFPNGKSQHVRTLEQPAMRIINDENVINIILYNYRYARLLLKAEYLTPRVEMLQKLNWLSVKQTIYLNTILYIHRIAIGLSPIYLQQHMTKTKECHQYPTRRNDEYQLKNYTKASSQNSLFYKGLKLYNEFTRYRKSKSNGTTLSARSVAIEFVTLNYPLD